MEIEEIREAVRAVIESISPGAGPRGIRPDHPLRQQIDLDSMDWLNLLVGLHERLSIDIPESDYGRLTTLDSIVGYLASRQAGIASRPAPTAGEAAGEPLVATATPDPAPTRTSHVVDVTPVTVRPISRDDLELEAEFIRSLSSDTRYLRFLGAVKEVSPAKLDSLTNVDQVRHVALAAVVEHAGREEFVGVARYSVDAAGDGCEFAITVADAWQGTGLAGVLMHALMDTSRKRGVRTMEGVVLATNSRMLNVARQLGFRLVRAA